METPQFHHHWIFRRVGKDPGRPDSLVPGRCDENGLPDVLPGEKRGFTGAEFRQVCETVAGVALPELFDNVCTVKEPDYAKYLAYGGLGIDLEPQVPPDGKTKRSFRIYQLPQIDILQSVIRKDWLKE